MKTNPSQFGNSKLDDDDSKLPTPLTMMLYTKSLWKKSAVSMFLLLVVIVEVAAQQQPECIFAQFDKSFYVSGETVWFKLYLLNDSSNVKSRVLYVDLLSPQNETITSQKLLIVNGSSSGSITLPMESEEGYYRFRAFTLYNLNFKPAYIYEKDIAVYQPGKVEFIPSPPIKSTEPRMLRAEGISIISDKEIYKPRDSLTVSFQIQGSYEAGDRGNFSVSVVPLEIASFEFESHQQPQCADRVIDVDGRMDYQRTLFLEGRLRDPQTQLNVTSKLITVYMDKTAQLIKTFSNEGKIKMAVYDYWGPGIFQVLNLDPATPTDFEFIVESGSKIETPYYNSHQPMRTSTVLQYIEQLEKRRKVVELFELYKPQEVKYSVASPMMPDAVYQTDDYRQIYSLEEFINAAISNVRVRKIDGFETVRLFNKDKGSLFEDHPWYMVDGFLTFNEREVLNIPYQDITEVRLYSKTSTIREYFKHFIWRSGVVEIITRDVKHARELKNRSNVVEIEGFTRPQDFNSTLTISESKITPDLRGVIYWSPYVLTNDQGLGQITIPLSDDTGTFAVVIMGTANQQKPVTGYTTFKVKQE